MNSIVYLAIVSVSLLLTYPIAEQINKKLFKLSLPGGSRDGCIDGLRGFLAIFVFFHHFYIFNQWKSTGEWLPPSSHYIENMGAISVQLFFMITSYLFIKKIKSGNVSWMKLYKSRFFRVTPLYIFAIIITFFYSSILSTGTTSASEYFKELAPWAVYFGDSFPTYADAGKITAGVTWTLKYEWIFYLLLPMFMIVIKKKLTPVLFIILCALYGLNFTFGQVAAIYFMSFAFGWMVVNLEERFRGKLNINFDTKMYSTLLLIFAAIAFSLNPIGRVGLFPIQILCFMIFFLVTQGCSIFGILRKRASILLGEVSYSIYLTHGIIIFTLSTFFGVEITLYTLPVIAVIVAIMAMTTFKYIEKPFINLGRSKVPHRVMPTAESKPLV